MLPDRWGQSHWTWGKTTISFLWGANEISSTRPKGTLFLLCFWRRGCARVAMDQSFSLVLGFHPATKSGARRRRVTMNEVVRVDQPGESICRNLGCSFLRRIGGLGR